MQVVINTNCQDQGSHQVRSASDFFFRAERQERTARRQDPRTTWNRSKQPDSSLTQMQEVHIGIYKVCKNPSTASEHSLSLSLQDHEEKSLILALTLPHRKIRRPQRAYLTSPSPRNLPTYLPTHDVDLTLNPHHHHHAPLHPNKWHYSTHTCNSIELLHSIQRHCHLRVSRKSCRSRLQGVQSRLSAYRVFGRIYAGRVVL